MKRQKEFEYEVFDYVDFEAGVMRTCVRKNNIEYSKEDLDAMWNDIEDVMK